MNKGKHLIKGSIFKNVTEWLHYEKNYNMRCDWMFSQMRFFFSVINCIYALFHAVPFKVVPCKQKQHIEQLQHLQKSHVFKVPSTACNCFWIVMSSNLLPLQCKTWVLRGGKKFTQGSVGHSEVLPIDPNTHITTQFSFCLSVSRCTNYEQVISL